MKLSRGDVVGPRAFAFDLVVGNVGIFIDDEFGHRIGEVGFIAPARVGFDNGGLTAGLGDDQISRMRDLWVLVVLFNGNDSGVTIRRGHKTKAIGVELFSILKFQSRAIRIAYISTLEARNLNIGSNELLYQFEIGKFIIRTQ